LCALLLLVPLVGDADGFDVMGVDVDADVDGADSWVGCCRSAYFH